jgi:3-ketosteroid 9alpha-monooxygenase subunit B
MFHSLRIAEIVDETPDAKSIVLEVPPALTEEFTYRAGQFLTIQVECGSERLQRCYSLASAPGCDREHKVTVKRVRGGRVSNWLHDRLRVGDRLPVMRPEGRFLLDNTDAPLLLFAAGSGITPIISILKTALLTTARRATLLYANRDEASVIFREELESLWKANPDRLRVLHRFDDVHGLLDEKAVHAVVTEAPGASCYVCGPGPFMELVERAATSSGASPERMRIERFTVGTPMRQAHPLESANPSDVPEYLDVGLRGVRHRVAYQAGKTLLQAVREGGVDAPYSCEEGFCGCCAADLLEGRVAMDAGDALSGDEKRRGMILTCQSRPLTRRCAFRFVDG